MASAPGAPLVMTVNDKPRAELILKGVGVQVHCFSPYPKPGLNSYFKAFCELKTGRDVKLSQSQLNPNQNNQKMD